MNNIKSINGLMKYLREKHNMSIEGSYDKKRLKYSNLMTDYKSYNGIKYKEAYKKRLDTFNRIQNTIAIKYAADNNIVSHYLKKDESIPIWAIFEIITLGEFGYLISTLELNVRKDISKDLGF